MLDHERLYCPLTKVHCIAFQQCRSILYRKDIQKHQANCRYVRLESNLDMDDASTDFGQAKIEAREKEVSELKIKNNHLAKEVERLAQES